MKVCVIALAFLSTSAFAASYKVATLLTQYGEEKSICTITKTDSGMHLQIEMFLTNHESKTEETQPHNHRFYKLAKNLMFVPYAETFNPSDKMQILYTAHGLDADGSAVQTPVYGTGARRIDSSSVLKSQFVEDLDSLCNPI